MYHHDQQQFIQSHLSNMEDIEYTYTSSPDDNRTQDCFVSSSGNNRRRQPYYYNVCDQTNNIGLLPGLFFNDNDDNGGWYDYYSKEIDNITNAKELNVVLGRVKVFKKMVKMRDNERISNEKRTQLEIDLQRCINERIDFKYRCVPENKRDKNHDAEILAQHFNLSKLEDVKRLFVRLQEKYEEFKKQNKQQRKEIRRRAEEINRQMLHLQQTEMLLYSSSSDESEQWEEVITPKRNSRHRH